MLHLTKSSLADSQAQDADPFLFNLSTDDDESVYSTPSEEMYASEPRSHSSERDAIASDSDGENCSDDDDDAGSYLSYVCTPRPSAMKPTIGISAVQSLVDQDVDFCQGFVSAISLVPTETGHCHETCEVCCAAFSTRLAEEREICCAALSAHLSAERGTGTCHYVEGHAGLDASNQIESSPVDTCIETQHSTQFMPLCGATQPMDSATPPRPKNIETHTTCRVPEKALKRNHGATDLTGSPEAVDATVSPPHPVLAHASRDETGFPTPAMTSHWLSSHSSSLLKSPSTCNYQPGFSSQWTASTQVKQQAMGSRCAKGHGLVKVVPTAQHRRWMCDVCGACGDHTSGKNCWRCTDCDYDLCEHCEAHWQHPVDSVLQCPGGHKLQVSQAASQPWSCNRCMRSGNWDKGAVRYTCSCCSYDRCDTCHQTTRATRTEGCHQTPHATCVEGHPLVQVSAAEQRGQWICDGCGHSSEQSSDKKSWSCSRCDYDLCTSCLSHWQRPRPSAFQCPVGHKLTVSLARAAPWSCSQCSRSGGWQHNSKRYTCLTCAYDRCDTCQTASPQRCEPRPWPQVSVKLHTGPVVQRVLCC